jgi:hypothetical protein
LGEPTRSAGERPSRPAGARVALAASGALAATVAALAYPIVRVLAAVVAPEPDPALVVWATRNALSARAALCAYAAALAWPPAYRWARRRPDDAARCLAPALVAAFLALWLQALLAP